MAQAGHTTAPVDRVAVLAEDRELLDAVSADRQARASEASVASVVTVGAGRWNAAGGAELARGGFGLLILDGALIRRVGLDGRYGAELLGKGDLLRPWEHDGGGTIMPFETAWRVVAAVRLAVLDLRWAAQMAPFPEVAGRLTGRVMERSRRLALLMAIAQHPRLDQRLWLLFWELADRYGVVHPDGVRIALPITHETLSHLAAAQRPSVTSALGRLARRGVLRREGAVWVITGDPPALPGAAER
jgi:CRP/FNR family transcriptional regulator, cyclic AMP receptor protein